MGLTPGSEAGSKVSVAPRPPGPAAGRGAPAAPGGPPAAGRAPPPPPPSLSPSLPLRRAAVWPAAPPLRAVSAAQVPGPLAATCQRLPPGRRGAGDGEPRDPAACRRAAGPGTAPAPARAAAPGDDIAPALGPRGSRRRGAGMEGVLPWSRECRAERGSRVGAGGSGRCGPASPGSGAPEGESGRGKGAFPLTRELSCPEQGSAAAPAVAAFGSRAVPPLRVNLEVNSLIQRVV